VSWQVAVFTGLALVVVGGVVWYERARPSARLVALVAALAALAVAGRLVFAPIPNVVATTDIALITGYALGGPPGFAVGALAAPISNIWLGQGPWTAWQMAGWGLTGLGGAWLAAATGRRLGRWGLAIACAVAGLAYGALLDLSVMVTYGGEQSLDRYLALSARGVPFNVAHAAGNFVLALAAGPALVRMISRYRTRLQFSWRPAGALPALLAALALVAGPRWGEPSGAGAEASAAAPGAARAQASQSSAWLARSQNSDGGFGATLEYPSSPAMTGWVMLGLEASGRNPLDVRSGGKTPISYLRSEIERLRSPGDLERTILALRGSGLDPRAFAGTDLVAALRRKRDRDGSVEEQVNLTAFFVLAMRAAGAEPGGLGGPLGWLRRVQNGDGGWGFRPQAPSDPDSTGAALQALAAAGAGGRSSSAGVRWLRRAQRPDGGYALATNGVVNAQSTAWAVQGLVAAGSGGGALRDALDHLARLRAGDGHYRYSRASDQTPVWVTAQALLAVERRPFPLEPVARRAPGGGGSGTGGEGDRSTNGNEAETPPAPSPSPGLTGPVAPPPGAGARPPESIPGAGGARAPGTGGAGSVPGAPGAAQAPGGGAGEAGGAAPALDAGEESDVEAGAEAPAGAPPTEPHAPAAAVESKPVAPYVAAGLGALALVLVAGFFWYRRRLP
jgi:energy-coupling factor transport system substrate-specific component